MNRKSMIILSFVAVLLSVLFQNCAKDAESGSLGEASAPLLDGSDSLNLVGSGGRDQFIGHLDSVEYTNGALIYRGWACKVGSDEQIKVYYGTITAQSGTERRINEYGDSFVADAAGEAAVATACQSSHGNHRFSFGVQGGGRSESLLKTGSDAYEFAVWTNPDNVPYSAKGVLPSSAKFTAGNFCNSSNSFCRETGSSPTPGSMGSAIGFIDEVREDQGQLLIRGWSCTVGYENKTLVMFETVGGDVKYIGMRAFTGVERESAVATVCQTTFKMHGFEIRLTPQQRSQLQGRSIKMYGVSETPSRIYYELANSGKFKVF